MMAKNGENIAIGYGGEGIERWYDLYTNGQKEVFELEIKLKNFKSFYGEELTINFGKPINLVVGLNDSGKSNLLQSVAFLLNPIATRYRPGNEYFEENKTPRDLAITSDYDWPIYDYFNEKRFLLTEGERSGRLELRVKINGFQVFQVVSFLKKDEDPIINDFPYIFAIDWSATLGSFGADSVIVVGDKAYHMGGENKWIDDWAREKYQKRELIVRKPSPVKVERVKDRHKEYLRSIGFKCVCDQEPKPEKCEPESVEFLNEALNKFRNLKPKFFDFVYLTPRTIHAFPERINEKIVTVHRYKELKGATKVLEFLENVIIKPIEDLGIGGIEDINWEDKLYTDSYRKCNLNWAVAAEGIKKIPILMYIAYLRELRRLGIVDDDFVSVILVDEVEQGLHPLKQRAIVERIREYIGDIQKNIKLIITTHSPIIWKEFIRLYNKNPELVDIFYVFRSEEGHTRVCKKGEVEAEEQEKILEVELGLSLYEMPRIAVFCEGPTDEEFLRGILEREVEERGELESSPLEEVDIYVCGGDLPSVVKEQLKRGRPLSYTRKVLFVGDEDQEENRKRKIEELRKIAKNFDIEDISFKPTNIEHFIFGEAEANEQPERIKSKLSDLLKVCSDDDREKVQGLLKVIKKEKWDYEKIKRCRQIYRILGNYWREILGNLQHETINRIIDFIL